MTNQHGTPMVNQKDVSEMQKLIDVMNGKSNPSPTEPSPTTGTTPANLPTDSHSFAVNDMKKILEGFYGAADEASAKLMEAADSQSSIREAFTTSRTDEGAIIGGWEVRVKVVENAAGRTRKYYDVVEPTTKNPVFKQLVIYEAAYAIVRYLNKGLAPSDKKIQEIADLEEMYRRNRQDAARFKQRFNRCIELKEQEAADVFEARYQTARANALVANDQIKSILDNIR